MKKDALNIRFFSMLFVLFMTAGMWCCASLGGEEGDIKREMADQEKQILAMTKDHSCKADNQCQTLAMGVKSCGGPKRYLVYSTKTSDANQLLLASNSYNSLDRRLNELNGTVGTCTFLAPPKLKCVRSTCTEIKSKSAPSTPQ